MAIKTILIGLVGAGALTAGMLTGLDSAHAATGACEDNIGYRINAPAKHRETGGNTVVDQQGARPRDRR